MTVARVCRSDANGTDRGMEVDSNVREMTPRDSRIHVAIVAAQPVVRVGLRHLLGGQESLVVIGEALRTADAAALVASEQPNVVVLDPDSEDPNLQTIVRIAEVSRGKVLVFTSAAEPAAHSLAVALGSMGVVQKHHSGETLRRAIERVHAGEIWLERQTTASLLRGFQRGGSGDPDAEKIRSLTKREREVIALIGSGSKNDAIALRLAISPATVRNHLTSILGKLELSDRFELAFYASGHGLVGERGLAPVLQTSQQMPAQSTRGIRMLGGRERRPQSGVAADSNKKRTP